MALKNYKVTQEDGSETYYQFDESDDVGKQGLAALQRAAKDADSPVKTVEAGDPKPINAGSSK